MEHYFAHRLVAFFWFGDEEAATRLGTLKYTAKGAIQTTLIDFDTFKKYKLMARQYLSLPQLLAVDFYQQMRKAGIIGFRAKRYHVLSTCKRINELPKSGWNVSKFKIKILCPHRCADVFIAYGTSFDLVPVAPRRSILHPIITYKGSEFVTRMKQHLKSIWVYGQVTPVGVFWGVRTFVQRMGWMKCKSVGGEFDNRKLFGAL